MRFRKQNKSHSCARLDRKEYNKNQIFFPKRLHLHFDGIGVVLSEIMRADIDGDGLEDILVGNYEYAIEGTYGAGSALLLTRKGPDEPFTFLSSVQLAPEKELR